MPDYRVELSPNNRAGCKESACKNDGVKITKGEIRWGVWVEIASLDRASWHWRHWGCLSGAVLDKVQDMIAKPDGGYDFDAIDGYDELGDHPDVQAKIRRAVEQGHVDLEDFKGDPEKCKPGEKGIYLTKKEKERKEAAEAEEAEEAPAPKKAKRGRPARDEEADEKPKAKKSRKSAASKAADEEDTTPAKPARGRKSAVKKEEAKNDEEEVKPTPVKKTKASTKAKTKAEDKDADADEAKKPAKKGRKAAAKDPGPESPAQPSKGRRGRPRKS